MSFGFGVGDFIAVYKQVNSIRKQFVDAPLQFKAIGAEVRSLSIVLQDAEVRREALSDKQAQRLAMVIDECALLLRELEATLDRYSDLGSSGKGSTLRRFKKRLDWEPEDIRDLRSRITAQVSSLGALETQSVSASVSKIVARQEDQKRQSLLGWVSEVDYVAQHNDFLRRHQPGTRKWLFESNKYKEWAGKRGAVLVCPGIPGAGKTITMSMVTEALRKECEADEGKLVVSFYCSYQHRNEEITELLCGFLHAVLQRLPAVPEPVASLYDKQPQKKSISREKASELLRSVLSGSSKSYVLIDALDEVPTTVRTPFIQELLKLHRDCDMNLLLTMRDIPDIHKRFTTIGADTLEVRASDEDVQRYLEDHVSQLPAFVARDEVLQKNIVTSIMEASSGMFLLAELHLQSLVRKPTKKAVRTALKELATGSTAYDDAYGKAMDRIASQGTEFKDLAMKALLIITCARRPLTAEELTSALGLDDDDEILDPDNIPYIEDVVEICSGIITIDEDRNVVRLVHKSTQDYLERHKAVLFPMAVQRMAYLCTRYLELITPSEETAACEHAEISFPFAGYAEANWGHHSDAADVERDGTNAEELANPGAVSAVPRFKDPSELGIRRMVQELPDLRETLLWACRKGRQGMLEVLLNSSGYDVNTPTDSERGRSIPQFDTEVAGRYKHEGTHLGTDYNPPRTDELDDVLLPAAAAENNFEIVKLLLLRGADPNCLGRNGKAALYIAAENDNPAMVTLLVDHPSIRLGLFNVSECYGTFITRTMTALHTAVEKGHTRCVKILVERVDLSIDTSYVRDVLCRTRCNWGPKRLAELLECPNIKAIYDSMLPTYLFLDALEQVNAEEAELRMPSDIFSRLPDIVRHMDHWRWSINDTPDIPLHWTARSSNVEPLPLSLYRELSLGSEDVGELEAGYTPLMAAICLGYLDATAALVPRSDINKQQRGTGYTALHWAAEHSDPRFVKAVLCADDIDVNVANSDGCTPFTLVIRHHKTTQDPAIVYALTSHPKFQPDANTAYPSDTFAYVREDQTGERLRSLSLVPFDINYKVGGWTLLHAACRVRGRSGLGQVCTLLAHPDIDVNAQDEIGWTPLMMAIRGIWLRAVEAILRHPRISINLCHDDLSSSQHIWGYGGDPFRQTILSYGEAIISDSHLAPQCDIIFDLLLRHRQLSTTEADELLHYSDGVGSGPMTRKLHEIISRETGEHVQLGAVE